MDPGHAFAVEDSTNGILSAHAAGLVVIAAPTPFHPPRPEVAALAAATIGGLDELTEELLARLTPRRPSRTGRGIPWRSIARLAAS